MGNRQDCLFLFKKDAHQCGDVTCLNEQWKIKKFGIVVFRSLAASPVSSGGS